MLGHIVITDVNEALPRALPLLLRHGKKITAASVANARPTIEWPGLFITEYLAPRRCVLFDPVRDANPLFHYLEAMWIIAGRQDVGFLAYVLPRMVDYSDDGTRFHAPYGHRLRHGFMIDQIETAIKILRDEPTSRQVVMAIWDPTVDLGTKSKDLPCNDLLMLKIRNGALNLTVSNRSNDVVWGCYGANVVQFSMLQMYMAARIGVEVGTYCQESDSFHVYEDNPYWQQFVEKYERDAAAWIASQDDSRRTYSTLDGMDDNLFARGIENFDSELREFFEEADDQLEADAPAFMLHDELLSPAVRNAVCIWNALHAHRTGRAEMARSWAWQIPSPDWRLAVDRWLARRRKA